MHLWAPVRWRWYRTASIQVSTSILIICPCCTLYAMTLCWQAFICNRLQTLNRRTRRYERCCYFFFLLPLACWLNKRYWNGIIKLENINSHKSINGNVAIYWWPNWVIFTRKLLFSWAISFVRRSHTTINFTKQMDIHVESYLWLVIL